MSCRLPAPALDEGCRNGVRLWREIRERGFAGGASTVRTGSGATVPRARALGRADGTPWKTPSGRRAAWLVVADAGEIDATERKFVDALLPVRRTWRIMLGPGVPRDGA